MTSGEIQTQQTSVEELRVQGLADGGDIHDQPQLIHRVALAAAELLLAAKHFPLGPGHKGPHGPNEAEY